MFIPFEKMVSTSRVWIYQSDKVLTSQDTLTIEDHSESFLQQWATHGQQLKSSYKIFHDWFLVISVDEDFNEASGCSIDASVGLVNTLQKELGINFFDRSRVCFLVNNEIFESPLVDIRSHVDSGKILPTTLTFNNLISDIESLNEEWLVQVENSWLKRYFR